MGLRSCSGSEDAHLRVEPGTSPGWPGRMKFNHAGGRAISSAQLVFVLAAFALIVALRFVIGPFILQGLLFVVVTAIAASLFGPSAAAVASLLGFVAAHVQ